MCEGGGAFSRCHLHTLTHTDRTCVPRSTHNWGTETDPDFQGYHNGNSDPRGYGGVVEWGSRGCGPACVRLQTLSLSEGDGCREREHSGRGDEAWGAERLSNTPQAGILGSTLAASLGATWLLLLFVFVAGHIGICVPDVEAACKRFEELGVAFVKKPSEGKMRWVGRQAGGRAGGRVGGRVGGRTVFRRLW